MLKKILFYFLSFNQIKFFFINFFKRLSSFSDRFLNKFDKKDINSLNNNLDISKIKILTIDFMQSLRVQSNGKIIGYKHSESCKKTNLYALISVLLIKHLFKIETNVQEELLLLKKNQSEDGLFRDENIECTEADRSDDWGWKHLTLHALMTLDLYSVKSKYPLKLGLDLNPENIEIKLNEYNWKEKLPWTSNAVQNLCVFLQYNRKYHNQINSTKILKKVENFINSKQSETTGLFSEKFNTFQELSDSVQSAYHFWLIYFSEGFDIKFKEQIIDNVLKTQNLIGGFGYKLNSSACEDIDSIDILLRLSKQTSYRKEDIIKCLNRSVGAILNNLNNDGGWVFRRNESLKIVHNEMFSYKNQSNMFYTWFRILGLCYASHYLKDKKFEFNWNLLDKKLGHQFKCW